MLVNFTKMHSLGNDFVVFNMLTSNCNLNSEQLAKIANRKLGVGCDQIIFIEPPIKEDGDFYFRAFNADGNEAEQCGNGLRCAVRYLIDSGLIDKSTFTIDCLSGRTFAKVKNKGLIEVNLGKPQSIISNHQLDFPGIPINQIYKISMGNPHGVCVVDKIESIHLKDWGSKISRLKIFPEQANISFMQVKNSREINLLVYERGVGPTFSCGSAASAAVSVANYLSLIEPHKVKVNFKYGYLSISINEKQEISIIGPTTGVFEGTLMV